MKEAGSTICEVFLKRDWNALQYGPLAIRNVVNRLVDTQYSLAFVTLMRDGGDGYLTER